jgi:hypothetical protein
MDQVDQVGRTSVLVRVGLVSLLVLGGGWVVVRGASFMWPGLLHPRQLEVHVDPGLTSNGGWKVGRTDLSQLPDREEWVEVTPTRRPDGELRVLVRHHRPPSYSETDLLISAARGRTPSIEVRGGAGPQHPDENIGGLVRINSTEIPPLSVEELIIEYRTVGDCAGSPVRREGKVILTRGEL